MDNQNFTLLEKAYNLHTSGNFLQAKKIYEQLISINPNDVEVLNLFAQLNVSLKEYDTAIEYFQKVYNFTNLEDIKINIAKVYVYKADYESALKILDNITNASNSSLSLLALIYMKKAEYKKAIKCYNALIKEYGDNFNNLYNISLCYSYINKFSKALECALKAFKKNEKDIDLLLHIAYLCESVNKNKKALHFLIKASEIVNDPNILYRIGILHKNIGNYNDAIIYFEKVLQICPNRLEALFNIASILKNINKKEALNLYLKIREYCPDDLNILICIYSVYVDMLNFEEAIKISMQLIEADPTNSLYYSMVADSYMEMFDYDKAIEYYEKAIKYNPKDEETKSSLAFAYSSNRCNEKALKIIKKLKKTPAVIQDYNIINLRMRNFKEVADTYYSWHSELYNVDDAAEKAKQYFYKLKVGEKYGISEETFVKFRSDLPSKIFEYLEIFKKKLWHKEDISNKNILVFTSHGAGDLILSLRYLNILSKIAKQIIVTAPNSLVDLIKYNFPYVEVYKQDDYIPESSYDFSTPEMGLIYNLDMDFDNIPYSNKYLDVSKKLVREKSKLKIFNTNKKKIGIFWQGNPTILRNRSINLKYLIPILKLKKFQFYSFQLSKVDFESDDLKNELPLIDLSSYINNYSDTAALLKNVDLLITIDTSIAHLAGALGIKTFLLLPYDADWRWFYDENNTDWYNSIKIFKQSKPNDWNSVIKRVKLELGKIS